MNKVILMGRLTRDPEVRYTQGEEALCIARFTLAVDRNQRRQEGKQQADFISCVAFGSRAQWCEKMDSSGDKGDAFRADPDGKLHKQGRREGLHDRSGCRRNRVRRKQSGSRRIRRIWKRYTAAGRKQAIRNRFGRIYEHTGRNRRRIAFLLNGKKEGGDMKLSEMARKAKEKLSGAFGRNRKEENSQETAEMDAQKAQEGQQDAKTGISSQNDEKGQETANTEPTGQEETVLGIDMASGQDMTGINTEELTKAFEMMFERLKEQTDRMAEAIRAAWESDEMKTVREMLWKLQKMGMTETQIRKRELWKRYYEEKAKMSNNERRRRGIPMVRRPKRQQYRTKKRKVKALSGDTKSIDGFCPYLGIVDECHAHKEESGQQDDGK